MAWIRLTLNVVGLLVALVSAGVVHNNDIRAVLILRRNLRRLQHAEVMATASNVHVEGTHCALNMTHLDALEMKILTTAAPGCTAERVCQELMQHGSDEFCEADDVVFHPDHAPNDPMFFHQWGMSIIEVEKAWDIHRGNGETIVGILDSGIRLDHPDLVPVLWKNPGEIAGNGEDDDNNGWVDDIHGVDVVDSDGVPQDEAGWGHGTHCGGIVGAAGNNGIGISGVMHRPKIMGLKFFGNGVASGSASLAAQAFNYGIKHGAKVTLMSFGNYQHSTVLRYAIERSMARNHIVVASAGNHGSDNDANPPYPCAYPLDNIICVGASHKNDQGGLADFSNYGRNTVHVAAPGRLIRSTWIGPDYQDLSGTSMAAPFVAGLAGLLFDYKPGVLWRDVRDAIINTADIKNFGNKVTCGRVNARRAMEALASGQIPRTCNGASSPAAPLLQIHAPSSMQVTTPSSTTSAPSPDEMAPSPDLATQGSASPCPACAKVLPVKLSPGSNFSEANAGSRGNVAAMEAARPPAVDQETQEDTLTFGMAISVIGAVMLVFMCVLLGLVMWMRVRPRHKGCGSSKGSMVGVYPAGPSCKREKPRVLKIEPDDISCITEGTLGVSEFSVVIDPASSDRCQAEVSEELSHDVSQVSTSAGLGTTTQWSIPSCDSSNSAFQESRSSFDVVSAIRQQLKEIGISEHDATLASEDCSTIESAMEWLMANGKL